MKDAYCVAELKKLISAILVLNVKITAPREGVPKPRPSSSSRPYYFVSAKAAVGEL